MKQKIVSRFIRVKCPKCKNEQIIFGKSSSKVKCNSCDQILAEPSGGKAKINGKIVEILN